MGQEEEQLPDGIVKIPLDGSYGAGADTELAIYTKTEDGRQRETTYTVPYLCLNMARLVGLCEMNLILGYKVVKSEAKTPGLKELGL